MFLKYQVKEEKNITHYNQPLMRKSGNLGGKVKGKVNITTYVTSNITSSPGRAAVKIRVGNTKRPLFVRAKAQPKFPDLTLPTTVVVEMPRSGKPGAFRVFKNSVRRGLFRMIFFIQKLTPLLKFVKPHNAYYYCKY